MRTHVTLSDQDIIDALRQSVAAIQRADGDRDYMNPSNLTVQQTTAIADLVSVAIVRFEPSHF